jgi:hypothetical protein
VEKILLAELEAVDLAPQHRDLTAQHEGLARAPDRPTTRSWPWIVAAVAGRASHKTARHRA